MFFVVYKFHSHIKTVYNLFFSHTFSNRPIIPSKMTIYTITRASHTCVCPRAQSAHLLSRTS